MKKYCMKKSGGHLEKLKDGESVKNDIAFADI